MTCSNTTIVTINSNSPYISETVNVVTPEYFTGLSDYPRILDEFGKDINRGETLLRRYGGVDNLLPVMSYFNNNLSPIVKDNPSLYPNVNDRIVRVGVTYVEMAEFMDSYAYPDTDTFQNAMKTSPTTILSELDRFLSAGLITTALGGLCSFVPGIANAVNKIMNGGLSDISAKLRSFGTIVKRVVDQLVADSLKKIDASLRRIQNLVSGFPLQTQTFQSMNDRIGEMYADLRISLSSVNVENLKSRIDTLMITASNAFKERKLDGSIVEYLLYLFCRMSSFVESDIKSMTEPFVRLSTKSAEEYEKLRLMSEDNTRQSVEAGRLFAEPVSLKQDCQTFENLHNAAFIRPLGNDQITSRLMEDLQKDFNLTRTQAAGIVGNLSHETQGFEILQEVSPLAGRGGIGYAQWTGARREAFERYVAERGLDITSYDANYGFLKQELRSGEGQVLNKIRNTDSVNAATEIFSQDFLRPEIPRMESRKSYANQAYINPRPKSDGLDGRMIFTKGTPTRHHSEWSNLSFTGKVINNPFWNSEKVVSMRDYGGGQVIPKKLGLPNDVGYWYTEAKVLEMLNEVGKMMGRTLNVTSAFRHPVYNQYLRNTGVGAAKNSQHLSGKALDVLMGGINRDLFVSRCKNIGFKGFGYYNSFIHVDIGPARSWSS
jgi:hypothetical protein